jgi:putative transcriptional regulator
MPTKTLLKTSHECYGLNMKSMAKQHRSELLAAIHETAEDLHAAGLMTKQILREFDAVCLTTAKKLSA